MEETLYEFSLNNHQTLLNAILEHENQEGICEVSIGELILKTDHSQSWVGQAINRINTEDICIQIIGRDLYKVHYKDLKEKGVFAKIEKLLIESSKDENFISLPDKFIAQQYDTQIKTVQMFKAYKRAGWPTPDDKPEKKPKKIPKWFLQSLTSIKREENE